MLLILRGISGNSWNLQQFYETIGNKHSLSYWRPVSLVNWQKPSVTANRLSWTYFICVTAGWVQSHSCGIFIRSLWISLSPVNWMMLTSLVQEFSTRCYASVVYTVIMCPTVLYVYSRLLQLVRIIMTKWPNATLRHLSSSFINRTYQYNCVTKPSV